MSYGCRERAVISAYVVVIRERVTDRAELDTYGQLARRARAGRDVTPLAAYGAVDVLGGPPVEREGGGSLCRLVGMR
jgi:hypothetical protein